MNEFFTGADFMAKPDRSGFGIEMYAYEAATIANRFLKERSRVVYGFGDDKPPQMYNWARRLSKHDTHTALLVCVQPLAPADTAESLLREYMQAREQEESWPTAEFSRWLANVRRLLGEKAGPR